MRSVSAALLSATVAASGGCDINFFLCEVADEASLESLPETLAETGIDDPDVIAYAPQFQLWSDGAEKRRWMALPAGSQIDTSDPDVWQFPVGTKLWKEFTRDGVRVETRLLERRGTGVRDWAQVSCVWDESDSVARAEPLGRLGARGTEHNVPAAGECTGCHGGRKSWILGVSAIQLAHDDGDPATLELADLEQLGLLSNPLPPSLEIPGDPTERAALGYLHANCAHCHNSDRPERDRARCFDPKNVLDFWLTTDSLTSVDQTATYRSAVEGGDAIERGRPADSDLIDRVDRRGFIYQMPPLGTELIDREAVALLTLWIADL